MPGRQRLVQDDLEQRAPGAPFEPHGLAADEFKNALLSVLVLLASGSKRRQADLTAALRRLRVEATPEQILSALGRLRDAGCVQDIIPLYDGGTLVSVTSLGMDQTHHLGDRRFLRHLHTAA